MDAVELSPVLDVIIPHKFNMPNFVKHKGTCLKAHMKCFIIKWWGIQGMTSCLFTVFKKALPNSSQGDIGNWIVIRYVNEVATSNISSIGGMT